MHKKLLILAIICGLCLMAAACGPSKEKVLLAQETYTQLAEIHNQTVEAYKDVSDDSMDQYLTEIREQISQVESYNLAEMEDEEIDELIQVMESLIDSYHDILEMISDIKAEEEAAVLVPIPVTITNNSGLSFSVLKFYEKGDYDANENVLEGMDPLESGRTMMGLVIWKDVDNTPWVLILEDTNGIKYEFELSVEEYEEEGVTLKIGYDSAEDGVTVEIQLEE